MTTQSSNAASSTPEVSSGAFPKRRIDPVLQEVYDLKAKLNAEAGYSVEKIFERVRNNAALFPPKV